MSYQEQLAARKNFISRLIQKYHLSQDEATAISKYLGSEAKTWNYNILQKKVTNEEVYWVDTLNSALRKLAVTPEKTTYRNFPLDKRQAKNALIFFRNHLDKVVEFDTFLSTTTHKKFNGSWFGYSLRAKIQTVDEGRGVSMQTILESCGLHQTENEVLFPTGSRFMVKAVHPCSRFQIKLVEVVGLPPDAVVPIFSY